MPWLVSMLTHLQHERLCGRMPITAHNCPYRSLIRHVIRATPLALLDALSAATSYAIGVVLYDPGALALCLRRVSAVMRTGLPSRTNTMAVLVCIAFSRACFAARCIASREFLISGFLACDKSRGFMGFSPIQGGWYTAGIIIQNPVVDCIAVMSGKIIQARRKAPANDVFGDIVPPLTDPCRNTSDGSFH